MNKVLFFDSVMDLVNLIKPVYDKAPNGHEDEHITSFISELLRKKRSKFIIVYCDDEYIELTPDNFTKFISDTLRSIAYDTEQEFYTTYNKAVKQFSSKSAKVRFIESQLNKLCKPVPRKIKHIIIKNVIDSYTH